MDLSMSHIWYSRCFRLHGASKFRLFVIVCLMLSVCHDVQARQGIGKPDDTPHTVAALTNPAIKRQFPIAAGLVVVPAANIHAPQPNVGIADFGLVSALDQAVCVHTFTLRNETSAPLLITSFKASCACLSVVRQSPATAASQPRNASILSTLEPGKEMAVEVTINLATVPAGPFLKTVQIFTQGAAHPVALMVLSGRVLSMVEFQPAFIDFGELPAGNSAPQQLTVTVSSQLAGSDQWPPLICSNPAIHIRRAAQSRAVDPAAPAPEGKTVVTQTYLLFPDKHVSLGPLSGTLFFAPDAAFLTRSQGRLNISTDAPHLNAQRSLQRLGAWTKSKAFIVGQIIGDVQARPSLLALGSLSTGRLLTGKIVLTAKSDRVLQRLQVLCSNPSVVARLEDAVVMNAGRGGPAERLLLVTLTSEAAPGILQAHVIVKLEDGQSLVIPVSAFVPPLSH